MIDMSESFRVPSDGSKSVSAVHVKTRPQSQWKPVLLCLEAALNVPYSKRKGAGMGRVRPSQGSFKLLPAMCFWCLFWGVAGRWTLR